MNDVTWADIENMFNNMRIAIHSIQGDSLGKSTLIDQIIISQSESAKHSLIALQKALEAKHER